MPIPPSDGSTAGRPSAALSRQIPRRSARLTEGRWSEESSIHGRCPEAAHTQRPQTQPPAPVRSEEHTSELQSLAYLVCRLLLEKKKPQRAALRVDGNALAARAVADYVLGACAAPAAGARHPQVVHAAHADVILAAAGARFARLL